MDIFQETHYEPENADGVTGIEANRASATRDNNQIDGLGDIGFRNVIVSFQEAHYFADAAMKDKFPSGTQPQIDQGPDVQEQLYL